MSTTASERVIPLAEAGKMLGQAMGLATVPRTTLHRWTESGVNGVRLDSVRVGHKKFTTANAVVRFLQALNPDREE